MDRVKLGDIAILINGDRGKNYPSQSDISAEGDIPFVNAGHLNGRSVDFSEMNYISKDKYDKLNSGKFVQGDILYCLRGSLGKKAIVSDNIVGAIASSLVIIRPDNNVINGQYLMFSLDARSIKEQLEKANNGSSQPNLSAASVRDYRIELPSLSIQTEIVNKLSKARYLIDRRTHELELLDNLIKARFVELFDNGNYPKIRLGDACKKITDGTHKTPNYIDEGITFISAKNIVNGELDFSDVKHISEEEYQEIQKRCQTEKNDILLSKSGSLGAPVIVRTEEKIGLFESLAVLKYERERFLPEFLCEQLKTDMIQRQFTTGTKGVAIKHLHLGVIADTEIIEPPVKEQKAFADFVKRVDKSKVVIQKALDATQLLFNSLMQLYFE